MLILEKVGRVRIVVGGTLQAAAALDLSASVAGSPFLGDLTKEPRIWAYGFRNPYSFTFRPNGSLYVADVGQSSREEIDAREELGWSPKVSFRELVKMMVDADVALTAREGGRGE